MEELPTSNILEKFESSHPDGYKVVSKFRDCYFDSFMDVLGYYIEWRPKTKNPKGFLDRLLKKWGVKQWIPAYPPATIRKLIENSYTTLSINDEATISIALSALLVDGVIGKQLKERAVVCINRQALDIVLIAAGHKDIDEAKAFFLTLESLIIKS